MPWLINSGLVEQPFNINWIDGGGFKWQAKGTYVYDTVRHQLSKQYRTKFEILTQNDQPVDRNNIPVALYNKIRELADLKNRVW